MPRKTLKTHVAEWEWLIGYVGSRETEPPAAGEGGDGPRGDYCGK